jgi:hypothetical protein
MVFCVGVGFASIVWYCITRILLAWFWIVRGRREDGRWFPWAHVRWIWILCWRRFLVSYGVPRLFFVDFEFRVGVATLGVGFPKSCRVGSVPSSTVSLVCCVGVATSASVCKYRIVWRPEASLGLIWNSEEALRRQASQRSVSFWPLFLQFPLWGKQIWSGGRSFVVLSFRATWTALTRTKTQDIFPEFGPSYVLIPVSRNKYAKFGANRLISSRATSEHTYKLINVHTHNFDMHIKFTIWGNRLIKYLLLCVILIFAYGLKISSLHVPTCFTHYSHYSQDQITYLLYKNQSKIYYESNVTVMSIRWINTSFNVAVLANMIIFRWEYWWDQRMKSRMFKEETGPSGSSYLSKICP